jgi:hypothetical protein
MAWRTQVRQSGIKFRLIWVTPFVSQILENMFFQPIRAHFEANKQTPYCFGNTFRDLQPRISKLRKKDSIAVIDFTAFDQSIIAQLIQLFFVSIKPCFKIESKSLDVQFEALKFFNTYATVANVENGNTILFQKDGSLSSGSVFTNFMGSWINLFLINVYLLYLGKDPMCQELNVMGDDCTFGFNFKFSSGKYAKFLDHFFFLKVEPSKCQELKPNFSTVEFLGADLNENGRYINRDLVIKQLCVSEDFIPETVMSEHVRLFSKLCSLCFKFSDGASFFDDVIPKLTKLLPYPDRQLPNYYWDIYPSSAGPFERSKKNKVHKDKISGWLDQ